MKRFMKSTTALVTAISLALPHMALAQAGEADPAAERAEQQLRLQQKKAAEQAAAKAKRQEERKEKLKAERQEKRKAERQEKRKAERAADRDAEPRLTSQQQADRAARRAARRRAAAADDNAHGDVVRRKIKQGERRRSNQEYHTSVNPRRDNDGISDLGKVVLFGLGVLAVSQILENNEQVVSNSGDRVVVRGDDGLRILKDDDALLYRPGSDVQTETFRDGSTRTYVTYPNGSQVVTTRAADGRVLRRTRILRGGRRIVLFDDTRAMQPVQVSRLPTYRGRSIRYNGSLSQDELRLALQATRTDGIDRRFSLAQIRNIDAVRRLVPEIAVENIQFETGSSAIRADQAQELATLGRVMLGAIEVNPGEVFLIEGHTDAVGTAGYNLALSDRRAETVALALSEYFDVPSENMVVQGYGESDLKVATDAAEPANRRVAVRRITPLLN